MKTAPYPRPDKYDLFRTWHSLGDPEHVAVSQPLHQLLTSEDQDGIYRSWTLRRSTFCVDDDARVPGPYCLRDAYKQITVPVCRGPLLYELEIATDSCCVTPPAPRDHKTPDGKIRVEFVPYELMEQAGCAMTYGVEKHGRARSWEDNTDPDGWLMYVGAAMRHLGKYLRSRLDGGDGRDSESGLSHLAGLAASVSILCRMEAKRDNLPTTWKAPTKVPRT
jgi:hypothetical protein